MYTLKPKTFLVLLCFFSLTFSYAQEKEITHIYDAFKINETYALFGDKVKLRAEPNTTSEVVTLLRIGDKITILKKTDQFLETSTSKTAWYEVSYNDKKGFIAGQFIATAHKKNGSEHFYFRKTLHEDGFGNLHIRTVFNSTTKVYHETIIKLLDNNIGITFSPSHDLKNVVQIVEVNYYGDSCGAENGTTVLFLKDNYELVKIADLSLIGDGGIYGLIEKFTYAFDEDNGQPIIIFTKEEEEEIDQDKRWFETKSMKRIYEWNGEKLVPEFSKEFKKRATSN